jgi:SAM-dependent methyltransferase
VRYLPGSAEALPLADDSADVVWSLATVHHWRDLDRGLAETRRVLRRPGRLALSVWGAPERNPWASIGGRILVERGHLAPPEPEAPGIFSMASEDRTRSLLQDAGFTSVRIEEVPVRFVFPDDVDYFVGWATETAGPFAMVLKRLTESEKEELKAQLEEAFVPFRGHDRYELPGVALGVVAS